MCSERTLAMAATERESIWHMPCTRSRTARGRARSPTAIRSRDLSHKGNERRQNEYVERTIKKALATIERGR